MRGPSVRQSCAIRRLIETGWVREFAQFISTAPGGCMPPECPQWKIRIEMSEYSGTGINKAVLKFARQDHKKSQIVSVISSIFLRLLFGNCCRNGG